jgi:hypothetical protein
VLVGCSSISLVSSTVKSMCLDFWAIWLQDCRHPAARCSVQGLFCIVYGCSSQPYKLGCSPEVKNTHWVFQEGMLLRIFGPKKEWASIAWRKLHSGEICNLYCLSDVIWVIKPKRMKWVEYVLHIHSCILNLFGKHEDILNEGWNVWGIGRNGP